MSDGTTYMTLEELLQRTNQALAQQYGEGETAAPFTERTLRYYVSQGLLPRLGTRGPGARYTDAFVWRLLFIRRLQQERSLTLETVRLVMEEVTTETMMRVVRGEEPLENALKRAAAALSARMGAKAGEVPLGDTKGPSPKTRAMDATGGEDAAAYLRRIQHRFDKDAGRTPRRTLPPWQTLWKDARSEIRIRGPLTDAQRRQIENLGALLKSILED